MKNLVIIPTFNEIENIPLILKEIFNLNMNLDVLVVDDNSPDKTYQKVEQLKQKYPNLFLILNNKKSGIGKAYLKGFNFAIKNNYSKVIQIDADMSHNPYDIKKLLSESNDYDLVIGSRYIDGIRIINWPIHRLLLSYFAGVYTRIITGLNVLDATGGFKCFTRKALESLNLDKVFSNGYSFQVELNFKVWAKGLKIKEVPIIFTERRDGESKMSGGIINEAIFAVIKLRLRKIFGMLD